MAYTILLCLPLAFFLVAYWASEAGRMWLAVGCAVLGLIGFLNLAIQVSSSG